MGARIEDLLPGKASDLGRSDLPTRYGACKSMHKRFTRWAARGIWERVLQSLIQDRSNEYLMIGSSIVRAHAQAATGKGEQRTRLWGVLPRRSEHEEPHGGGWPGPPGAIYPHWRPA